MRMLIHLIVAIAVVAALGVSSFNDKPAGKAKVVSLSKSKGYTQLSFLPSGRSEFLERAAKISSKQRFARETLDRRKRPDSLRPAAFSADDIRPPGDVSTSATAGEAALASDAARSYALGAGVSPRRQRQPLLATAFAFDIIYDSESQGAYPTTVAAWTGSLFESGTGQLGLLPQYSLYGLVGALALSGVTLFRRYEMRRQRG